VRIMSAEWLEFEESRREEESRLRGVEPAPRYTFGQLIIEAIHGINQADESVIEGTCSPVNQPREQT
jgi:hypothetical protein